VYSKYKENFLTKVIDSVHNSENLDIVHDQIGIPTSSEFIAKVVMNIINHNIPYGTYNVVPNGCASWHDFSSYIVDKLKDYKIKPVDIKKINSKELNLVAKRPLYSVLDNEKLKKNTNIEIKDWQYYVDQLLEEGIFDT
jgi:dTDP-4-dehydrorhamnose reductase